MLGLFPKLFVDFLTETFNAPPVDEILRESGISPARGVREDKIYTDEQWQRLIQVSCEQLGTVGDFVETAFARYFAKYSREKWLHIYQAFFSSKELFANLPAVHRDVIERYLKPTHKITGFYGLLIESGARENAVEIHYCSPNKLCLFLEALADEVIRFYGDEARIEHTSRCMKRGDDECAILITWDEV